MKDKIEITGSGFFAGSLRVARPLSVIRFDRGQARSSAILSSTPVNGVSFASPLADVVLCPISPTTSLLIHPAARRATPIPASLPFYLSLSYTGRFAVAMTLNSREERGYSVQHLQSGRLLWSEVGAMCPLWSPRSNTLFYAKLTEGKVHIFALRFDGALPAVAQRITERDMAPREGVPALGTIYNSYLRFCFLNRQTQAYPQPGEVTLSPRGDRLLITTSHLAPEKSAPTSDNAPNIPTAPERPGDVLFHSTLIRRDGIPRRLPEQNAFLPVNWSRDGRRLYGQSGALELENEDAPNFLMTFDTDTNVLRQLRLPSQLERLIAFIEE